MRLIEGPIHVIAGMIAAVLASWFYDLLANARILPENPTPWRVILVVIVFVPILIFANSPRSPSRAKNSNAFGRGCLSDIFGVGTAGISGAAVGGVVGLFVGLAAQWLRTGGTELLGDLTGVGVAYGAILGALLGFLFVGLGPAWESSWLLIGPMLGAIIGVISPQAIEVIGETIGRDLSGETTELLRRSRAVTTIMGAVIGGGSALMIWALLGSDGPPKRSKSITEMSKDFVGVTLGLLIGVIAAIAIPVGTYLIIQFLNS